MNKVTLENSLEKLEQLDELFEEIPLQNTDFQIRNFVIGASITPERAYRTIGLNLRSLLSDLNDSYITLLEAEDVINDLEKEYEEAQNNDELTENQKKVLLNNIKRRKIQFKHTLKLIKDQEVQANVYYEELQKFPKYNKLQFEKAEAVYYLESLKRQALGMAGAKSSLINMLDDHRCLENFKEAYAKLPKDQQHLLEQITNETMKNYMPNEVDGKTISSSQYIAEQKHGEK